MKTIRFEDIIKEARNSFQTSNCLHNKTIILDYLTGQLSKKEKWSFLDHMETCEECRIEVLKLEADQIEWELLMEHKPESAVTEIMGTTGEAVPPYTKISSKPEREQISILMEKTVQWFQEMWQPMYAGEPVTASSLQEQTHPFQMEEGEYINITCHWQGKEAGDIPFIRLVWQANIYSPGNIWARFVDPKTHTSLASFCLGNSLSGEKVFWFEELGFDPTKQKFAVSVGVEEP